MRWSAAEAHQQERPLLGLLALPRLQIHRERQSSTNAGAFSEALLDEIYQEHPDWAFSRIYAEAARRASAPPLGSSGEPSAEG